MQTYTTHIQLSICRLHSLSRTAYHLLLWQPWFLTSGCTQERISFSNSKLPKEIKEMFMQGWWVTTTRWVDLQLFGSIEKSGASDFDSRLSLPAGSTLVVLSCLPRFIHVCYYCNRNLWYSNAGLGFPHQFSHRRWLHAADWNHLVSWEGNHGPEGHLEPKEPHWPTKSCPNQLHY